MKILYVSQYYPPEVGAPAARVSELSRRWVSNGHRVTVLTGFPNHPTGEIHPDYLGRWRRLFFRETLDGVDVVRTWLAPFPNRKSWERIVNYSSFCLSAIIRGIFLPRPDVVIGTSPQLLVALSAWVLGRLKRCPVVFEVRDIWPDGIIASGIGSEDSLLARGLTALSRFLYERSDRVVVVSPAFEKELVEKHDVPAQKISLVVNGVETDLFTPEGERDQDRSVLGFEPRFLVSYIGTIGFAHGVNTLLRAAELLAAKNPEVDLLVLGEGAEKESLREAARRQGLSNLHVMSQRPRNEIPSILRASDICLVLLKKTEVFKTVIPTKMLEFMACGRPVIVAVDGQARQIVEEARAGLFSEPEDPEALVHAIETLYSDPIMRADMGVSGRGYILDRMSRRATADEYLRVLAGVAVGASNP